MEMDLSAYSSCRNLATSDASKGHAPVSTSLPISVEP